MKKVLSIAIAAVLALSVGTTMAATNSSKRTNSQTSTKQSNGPSPWTTVVYTKSTLITKDSKSGNFLLTTNSGKIDEIFRFSMLPKRVMQSISLNKLLKMPNMFPSNGLLKATGVQPTAVTFLGVRYNKGKLIYLIKPMTKFGWQSKPLTVKNLVIAH